MISSIWFINSWRNYLLTTYMIITSIFIKGCHSFLNLLRSQIWRERSAFYSRQFCHGHQFCHHYLILVKEYSKRRRVLSQFYFTKLPNKASTLDFPLDSHPFHHQHILEELLSILLRYIFQKLWHIDFRHHFSNVEWNLS